MAATDVYARDMSDERMAALEGCRVPFEFIENEMRACRGADFRVWVFVKSRQPAVDAVPLSMETVCGALGICLKTLMDSIKRLDALGLLYSKKRGFGSVKSFRVFDSKEQGDEWKSLNA